LFRGDKIKKIKGNRNTKKETRKEKRKQKEKEKKKKKKNLLLQIRVPRDLNG
jgi:hypothetical protein